MEHLNCRKMNITYLFLALFLINSSLTYAKQNYIELTHFEKGKTKSIQEGKRIKINTLSGDKIIGKFRILNEETIVIKGQEIRLDSIESIKRKSALAGIIGTYLMVAGIVATPFGFAAALSEGLGAAIGGVTLVGSVFALGSGILINDFPVNNKNSKWNYNVVYHE